MDKPAEQRLLEIARCVVEAAVRGEPIPELEEYHHDRQGHQVGLNRLGLSVELGHQNVGRGVRGVRRDEEGAEPFLGRLQSHRGGEGRLSDAAFPAEEEHLPVEHPPVLGH